MVPSGKMKTVSRVNSLGLDAVAALRTTRRKHRVEEMEWFEALYRVYLAAIAIGGTILFLSGLIKDTELTPAELTMVSQRGPHVLGVVIAVALFIGIRSGNNGGPLAVEEAEVRHLLLAPVSHAVVLRRPAIQRLRSTAFSGAAAGAIAGQLASRRLPGSFTSWAFYGAVFGLCAGLIVVGGALLSHGLRFNKLLSSFVVTALLAWQVAMAVQHTSFPGPFDAFGSMALWTLHREAIDLIAVFATIVICSLGIFTVGNLSLEALSRRSSLVSQLRFAVTLQDLRTVVLLRRQLSQEQMRASPWVTLKRSAKTSPIPRRGLQSLLKFPARRLVRMKLLIAVAAMCQVWAYRGTTPAVVASGLCLFVFGLEIIEPLSQEVDKPDRTDAIPIDRGELMLRHLIVPTLFLLPFGALGILVAYLFEPEPMTLAIALIVGLPAIGAGTAGAIINAVKGAPDPMGQTNERIFMPPEVAGMTTMTRAVWPPIVAILGSLPILAVREGVENGDNAVGAALRTAIGVVLLLGFVGAWVRHRDAARQWWKSFVDGGKQSAMGQSGK